MSCHHLTQEQHPQIQRLKSRLIGQKQIAVLPCIPQPLAGSSGAIKANRVIVISQLRTSIDDTGGCVIY